ncbi:hypothetical protein DLM78_13560 [Leptospira stimsonii]|uniref:Ankyrin repeat domain-containing protein n=1 Tax=Leptospira stimsonii TaxID=2202203 RepID=A0A8B3CSX0_9LEPT|nr:hypothetical protein DLM78_13560 [Leptospira stimsonii]
MQRISFKFSNLSLSFQNAFRCKNCFVFFLHLCFPILTLNVCTATVGELIQKGKTAEVIEFLEKNSDWNQREECESPLSIASRFHKTELLKILLQKGADPNFRSKGCSQESLLIIDGVLISKDYFFTATQTPLSHSSNKEVADILIDAGANPNIGGYRQDQPSGQGLAHYQPPLLIAILDRKYELAKYLIQKGASTEIFNPLTGENELELWFSSVGIRSQKDRKFYQYLRSLGLKKIILPSRIKPEKDDQTLSYVHLVTKRETKRSIASLRENGTFETDLVYSDPDQKYFHSSEFARKDTGQNLYEWILQRRLLSKKR